MLGHPCLQAGRQEPLWGSCQRRGSSARTLRTVQDLPGCPPVQLPGQRPRGWTTPGSRPPTPRCSCSAPFAPHCTCSGSARRQGCSWNRWPVWKGEQCLPTSCYFTSDI